MPKRLLNMSASDFAATSPMDLKQAILASEGRTIMAENVPSSQFLGGVTNAEIERAAGADLLLFNALDVFDPVIAGIPDDLNENPVTWEGPLASIWSQLITRQRCLKPERKSPWVVASLPRP